MIQSRNNFEYCLYLRFNGEYSKEFFRFQRKWTTTDSVSQTGGQVNQNMPQSISFPPQAPQPEARQESRGFMNFLRNLVPRNRDDSDEDVEAQICRPVHNPLPPAAPQIRQVTSSNTVHISQVALSINGT